ncbi:MAG: hypothetical protein ACOYM3_31625 [Terrimicrobiaceae bacterium]
MAADTPKPELRRSAYDFCEQALARFEATPNETSQKGFSIARSQTISGDCVQRSYIIKFDLKLTGCELP